MANNEGCRIPYESDEIELFRSQAKFVLIVEKDSVFRRIVSDITTGSTIKDFENRPELILITAKGMPDRATRYFLRILVDSLEIPVFGLFDCDAYGINIAVNYKLGAQKVSNFEDRNLLLPEMMWIGVWPSEIDKILNQSSDLYLNNVMNITSREVALLTSLSNRPDVKESNWAREIEIMRRQAKKIEIEALYDARGYRFLIDHYLRYKLNNDIWL